MLRVWIATVLNFFLPGAGYLVNGQRKLLGAGFLAGVLGLTYVELSLQTQYPALYWPMFISVFVMNTCFAIDAFKEGRALIPARAAQARLTPRAA